MFDKVLPADESIHLTSEKLEDFTHVAVMKSLKTLIYDNVRHCPRQKSSCAPSVLWYQQDAIPHQTRLLREYWAKQRQHRTSSGKSGWWD